LFTTADSIEETFGTEAAQALNPHQGSGSHLSSEKVAEKIYRIG